MAKKNIFRFASVILLILVCVSFRPVEAGIFTSQNGKVKFVSEAPLELIKAESEKLISVIDVAKRSFAFSIIVESFEGFNSPLQKEHFRENYMETNKYKTTTFKGKIIEEIDLSKEGTYNIRAKGTLDLHGVQKEKIIKGKLIVKSGSIEMDAKMDVPLEEHNIKVPKVVNQKISQIISVEIKATLLPKK
ncbi:MAG: YceI family protein [Bacteroidia bacterium]|nr:YceI family protein [Bacteroidia bacterium]